MPSRSLDFKDSYLMLGPGAVLPPMVATESGYHTCLGNSKVIAGAQAGVSHLAHKKYISRHVAEYFNAGFKWTVIYEFAAGRPNKAEQEDPEAAFGLLMPDASPKPAYFALKDLISVISESKWDSASGKWIRPVAYQPQALSFALKGAPETLHHTLLQRSDGTFQLLLWNEVPSFDLRNRKDISNSDVPVKLVLASKASRITVTHLGPDAPPKETYESVNEIEVKVPDEVIVVGIRLDEALKPAVVKQPAGIDVKSGATSVEFSWQSSPAAAAYWITMNKRNLGRAQIGSDGRATFKMGSLIPATTYPFEIVATSFDGGVSMPAKVSATTVDAFPDLVVRSLKTVPESPKEGDAVKFVAIVENCGNAPVEEGVTVGTKFSVDGKTVCWCDSVKGPMAPGQKVEVRPNSGPTGETSWKLVKGTHQVSAFVDDVNRIVESNEANNRLTVKVGTGSGPDLVVKDLKVRQAQKGKPLVADVVVENRGSEAVPKGASVSANIARMDVKPPKTLGFSLDKEGVPAGGSITMTVKCEGEFEPGRMKVRATVDDVDRIPETDDANNSTEFDIDIGG